MFYPKTPFLKCPDMEKELFKQNDNCLSLLLTWLCEAPKSTTYRVNLNNTTAEKFKNDLIIELKQKYEIIPKIYTSKEIPEVICVEPIESQPIFDPNLKEIIVDGNCGAALLRGSHIYAPGVLAIETGTKINEAVNVFLDFEGKCKKGTNVKYESSKKIFIGIGLVKMQRYQLYGHNINPKGIAVEMKSTISKVPSIGDLSSNKALLQNFPSIVCSRVLNPQINDIILDMCAAPGNKTTHIAELINDNGIIIALDKTESKIKLLQANIDRYNFKSIISFQFDSTKALNKNMMLKRNVLEGPPFDCESFDRILLDGPCSALGNRPLLTAGNLKLKMLQSYPNVQKKLFENAVGLLKPGGTLVYSTCTITEAENEEIIVWANENFKNIKLVEAAPIFGGPGLKHSNLSDQERRCVQRFSNSNKDDRIDSIGFFIAKFVKQ